MKQSLLHIAITCITLLSAFAQRNVTLKDADVMVGGLKDGQRIDRVIGNVVFVQNETTIYCDSAIFNRGKGQVEAFGRVRIVEGDSITITSRRLEYDGNTRIAKLRQNVVFTKLATATLYTNNLDYYRDKNLAIYFNGGKLVDSVNVLESRKGYYDVNYDLASFKTNVVGTNPDYVLKADTMQYNTSSKVIYFHSLTNVTDKDGNIFFYESGEYDTNSKLSRFASGKFQTEEYELDADKLFLDDATRTYRAKGNVVMVSKEQDLTIYADDSDYFKAESYSKIYGNPLVTKLTDNFDTLFLKADTLISIESEDPTKKRLLAYPNVKIYKQDLQGIADSLVYFYHDSTMVLYRNPVLWTEGNQMTADTIKILISNNSIDKLFLTSNSFVISQDTLKQFNQVKGRKMTALFKEGDIHRVLVEGNGESLYHAIDEGEDFLMGVNRIICSNMLMYFRDRAVYRISFYIKPDAKFIPPHELKDADKTLSGFAWKAEFKPLKRDVVKRKIPLKATENVLD
jgi:lipopolysaccharide export system protein LptA